jgi:hypothetical protein
MAPSRADQASIRGSEGAEPAMPSWVMHESTERSAMVGVAPTRNGLSASAASRIGASSATRASPRAIAAGSPLGPRNSLFTTMSAMAGKRRHWLQSSHCSVRARAAGSAGYQASSRCLWQR